MSRNEAEAYVHRPPEADPAPLIVSIPHTGTEVPTSIAERFASPQVRALPDTDWHLHHLYAFAPRLGAHLLHARYSRYVVDLNRPPDGEPLYPGRFETGLVPTTTFDGDPLYRSGAGPDAAEVAERRERYWVPYHRKLQSLIEDVKAAHGFAIVFEAHSIRSQVPKIFEGRLPDLVVGDAGSSSCDPVLSSAVLAVHAESGYESSHNHPFRGGWITRHYGRPETGVHGLQLEMAQALYMDEAPPFDFDPARAARLEPVLEATLEALLAASARLAV
jgi:N-formylglutamate deformylase